MSNGSGSFASSLAKDMSAAYDKLHDSYATLPPPVKKPTNSPSNSAKVAQPQVDVENKPKVEVEVGKTISQEHVQMLTKFIIDTNMIIKGVDSKSITFELDNEVYTISKQ